MRKSMKNPFNLLGRFPQELMEEFNNTLAEKEGLQKTVEALQAQYRNSEEGQEVKSLGFKSSKKVILKLLSFGLLC